jgi:phosphate transport system permease protein
MSAIQISQPPSASQRLQDKTFRYLCQVASWATVFLIVVIVLRIATAATPAIQKYHFGFLTGRTWNPNQAQYSILPEIWGTLYSSLLALVAGSAFGIAAAVFMSEGYLADFIFRVLKIFCLEYHRVWGRLPDRVQDLLRHLIELLAAIPSVVYGLWGLFVVIPLIRPACNWLHAKASWVPFFSTDLSGPGMLPAAFVLSVMILPTIAAISRSALVSVPNKLRMAAYGLGATRWETLLGVIIPTAAGSIFGGIVLAFGRALGETMALAMLVGNSNKITVSLFSPANTLAALLANNFPEARGGVDVAVLMYAALVLLAITLVVNAIGSIILQHASARIGGNE